MPKRAPSHMQAQRERILRAAIRCISNLGLEGTSVAEIRKEAEMSAGAIYKHFASKEEIIAEALRFAAMTNAMLPGSWADLKATIAAADDQMGFDAHTIARAQLQLFATSLRPGPLHDMVKPIIEQSLASIAQHLSAMEGAGKISLRMTPIQTALCISALADGLLWIGLARDRSLEEISRDIAAGLECMVSHVA